MTNLEAIVRVMMRDRKLMALVLDRTFGKVKETLELNILKTLPKPISDMTNEELAELKKKLHDRR